MFGRSNDKVKHPGSSHSTVNSSNANVVWQTRETVQEFMFYPSDSLTKIIKLSGLGDSRYWRTALYWDKGWFRGPHPSPLHFNNLHKVTYEGKVALDYPVLSIKSHTTTCETGLKGNLCGRTWYL